jgi:sigma-B regulation protein RsbU (phosphoserine phosphatase)
MRALNEALIERKVEARYVSLLVLQWNPKTRLMVMANAGSLPPMICRNGEILKIRLEGVPLGLLESRDYEEVEFQAEPGDVVVLYSDGISDHLSPSGQEYGRGRLARVVRANCKQSAVDLIRAIFKDLDKFSITPFDDQTIFAIKVK